jgi:protein-L-isoaspartate(D-aspartate) O-methyltransferase
MTPELPSLDIERARQNMVEQQIRPWEVLDQSVLDLLLVVRREQFVPHAYRLLAFTDMEIPLKIDGVDTGESMLAPKVEARLLQELGIRAHEHVLEVGTGSGYMAALAAHKAQHVLTIEINPLLAGFGAANLERNGVRNVRVETGDGARGWPANAPYDVIIMSGSLPVLPPELLAQLKIGGRLAAIVGDAPVMTAQIVTRVDESAFDTLKLFETVVKPLANAWRPSSFRF